MYYLSRQLILAKIKNTMRISMSVNRHQPTDKSYKFMYKRLGIDLHQYFFKEGEEISFMDTEIATTAQRRDITCKIDGICIWDVEFQSSPLSEDKLVDIYSYCKSLRCDPNNDGLGVRCGVINTSNPNWGRDNVEIGRNLNFHPDIIYTKKINGWEVLNKLIYKVITQEELSKREAIDLLILPDMDIDLPQKALMKVICFLIGHVNIFDVNFKNKIVFCEKEVLKRFFDEDEMSEMVKMLRDDMENPKVAEIVSKYGRGYEEYYYDGIAEGVLQTVERGIIEGIDFEIISRMTGFSIRQIKQIKSEL